MYYLSSDMLVLYVISVISFISVDKSLFNINYS